MLLTQASVNCGRANIVQDVDAKRLGALPTATGGITRLAYARAQAAGIELAPLLKKAGLTEQQIKDPRARLNVHHQIQFLNLAANALQDELLGFHLAQLPDLREIGLLYYVAASSETLGDALQRASRYSSIDNEGVALRYLEGKDLKVAFEYVGVARYLDRHQIEFFVTMLIRLCRQLTGRRLVPSGVRFTHRRSSECSEFPAYFGGEVHFGTKVDELALAGSWKDTMIASADPYLNKLLVANREEALSRQPTHRGPFRSAVENAIVPVAARESACF